MGKVLFDLTKKEDRVKNCISEPGDLVLNLKIVQDPKPTEKMIMVLHNLRRYQYITTEEHDKAVNSFPLASSYIEDYQELMHKEIDGIVKSYRNNKSYNYDGRRDCRFGSSWDDAMYECFDYGMFC